MSVNACIRRGCNSVMCDYLCPSLGHLCGSCREELIAQLQMTSDLSAHGTLNRSEILAWLRNSVKDCHTIRELKRKYVEELFPRAE